MSTLTPDKNGYYSLAEVFGKKVVDAKVYVSEPFGERLLLVTSLTLEDGTELHLGGEHDAVFIEDSYRSQGTSEHDFLDQFKK